MESVGEMEGDALETASALVGEPGSTAPSWRVEAQPTQALRNVAGYTAVSAELEEGVRWELLQQHTTAAPPAAAAPANSTKLPAAAVPVSTVAHSNNLHMYSLLLKATLDHISRAACGFLHQHKRGAPAYRAAVHLAHRKGSLARLAHPPQ